MTKTITLKDLPHGAYFKRKHDAKKLFIRDAYCRSLRKYYCFPADDVWGVFPLEGSTIVYIDEDFQRGIEAAQDELRHPDCDLIALICSFDGDPADSAFQRGYLHMLLAANEEIGA